MVLQPANQKTTLLTLPSDVLIIITSYLVVSGLTALSESCRFLHSLVCDFGWSNYLRSNARPSFSLSRAEWSPRARVRYNTLTDRAWSTATFVARPIGRRWMVKVRPLLAINRSRLVVAAGNVLYSYKFISIAREGNAPRVVSEGFCFLGARHEIRRSVTGITFVPDGGLERTLVIAYDDGVIESVLLSSRRTRRSPSPVLAVTRCSNQISQRNPDAVESLASEGNFLLSLSEWGRATLVDLSSSPSHTSPPQSVELNAPGWSTHLSLKSSTPYAAFGTSSMTPLVVHPITYSELSPSPSAILGPYSTRDQQKRGSAVYGITVAPPSSPIGTSDQILISGWYDGLVRVHDLRSSARVSTTDSLNGPAPLLPVLKALSDPWCPYPIYSVSSGGGSSAFIAAGSARHGVVSFWDVRYPRAGWSVHAPGNDSSPVYKVILESSRLFGVTQSRPFVYDFGPGVTSDTYPFLGLEGLRYKPDVDGIGYYVTTYSHRSLC